jgi:hypothetical protein
VQFEGLTYGNNLNLPQALLNLGKEAGLPTLKIAFAPLINFTHIERAKTRLESR